MHHRRNDDLLAVTENKEQLQDFVESNAVRQLSEHHTVSVTDKQVESRTNFTIGQKHSNKKKHKTQSMITDGVVSSECDDASKIEGQHQKIIEEHVATSDTDQHAHSQTDQRLEPFSGMKDVLIPVSVVFSVFIFIEQLFDI